MLCGEANLFVVAMPLIGLRCQSDILGGVVLQDKFIKGMHIWSCISPHPDYTYLNHGLSSERM